MLAILAVATWRWGIMSAMGHSLRFILFARIRSMVDYRGITEIPMPEKASPLPERPHTFSSSCQSVKQPLLCERWTAVLLRISLSDVELLSNLADCITQLVSILTTSIQCSRIIKRSSIQYHLRTPDRGFLLVFVASLFHCCVRLAMPEHDFAGKQKGDRSPSLQTYSNFHEASFPHP